MQQRACASAPDVVMNTDTTMMAAFRAAMVHCGGGRGDMVAGGALTPCSSHNAQHTS